MKELFEKTKKFILKMAEKEFVPIGLLIVVYTIISFINLGSLKNPQTFTRIKANEEIVFELSEGNATIFRVFLGDEVGKHTILASTDGTQYHEIGTIDTVYCFSWNDINIDDIYKYFKLRCDEEGDLGEVAFLDKNLNIIDVKNDLNIKEELLDEPKAVPEVIGFMNSTYFDEVYFARSAYQYVHNIPVMEWTHPPLGKLLQAIPILFLGMTPFAYRLMGNLAGIAVIAVMYLLAKEIFGNRKYALLAAFIMAFDNFHFAQTRMGTSDGFLLLFCLTSGLFMYKYLKLNIADDNNNKKIFKYLGLSGLFWGLATSVKWNSFYFGLGLAIVFFIKLIYDIVTDKKTIKKYIKIALICVVFFIVIPLSIYALCFFLFPNIQPNGGVWSIQDLIEQTKTMYNYHATLDAEHPFTSPWYTWPLMLKPVWYHSSNPGAGMASTISGIGNPAIWWVGALTFIYAFRSNKKENIFITIMALVTWLPYIFIGRIMFLYHYILALPFVMLGIVSFIKLITEKLKKNWIIIGYMAIVLVFFSIFYPIVSGHVISEEKVESLKWLEEWYF